ncbi:Aste57867_9745 [Aphanomyces stellatus]|uniref:Aste57867_9745 protein n=1 Tax=Aphanomyces stellatus TaxID=120398 RepID=A0A485KNN2_9STRA|nr:hypothetical protein As57867_009706 [Aphanomyces stellatus]VFT86624.1 Aste57867_9745 [Aphanomyces stellatus]
MNQTKSAHRPYSEKQAALAEWTKVKDTGVTKVQFSRSRGTAISTFEKWCAKEEAIAGVQDGNIKHISGNLGKRRGSYKKKRPSDAKESAQFDWIQLAPKPIDKVAMRKKAHELWPEFRDETSPACKTPGSYRKCCNRFAERFTPILPYVHSEAYPDANSDANPGANSATNAVANADVNPDANLAADSDANSAAISATNTDANPDANPDANTDANTTANFAINPTTNSTASPAAQSNANDNNCAYADANDDGIHAMFDDITQQLLDEDTPRVTCTAFTTPPRQKRSRTTYSTPDRSTKRHTSRQLYPAADPLDFTALYKHIEENQVVEERHQPARLAKGSHSKNYNSGEHSQSCAHCSHRSPCDDFDVCQNLMVYTNCSSGRCRSGKHCKNMTIQKKDYPNTTVVVDPIFGYGLRFDEDVSMYRKIVEYVGERISKDEYKKRLAEGLKTKSPLYLAQLTNDAP